MVFSSPYTALIRKCRDNIIIFGIRYFLQTASAIFPADCLYSYFVFTLLRQSNGKLLDLTFTRLPFTLLGRSSQSGWSPCAVLKFTIFQGTLTGTDIDSFEMSSKMFMHQVVKNNSGRVPLLASFRRPGMVQLVH
jgi:hypothetical protein